MNQTNNQCRESPEIRRKLREANTAGVQLFTIDEAMMSYLSESDLHINNDEGLQAWALNLTEELVEEYGPTSFNRIGDRIVDGFEDIVGEMLSEETFEFAIMVMSDVGSFWRIDPVEIGEAFIDAVSE